MLPLSLFDQQQFDVINDTYNESVMGGQASGPGKNICMLKIMTGHDMRKILPLTFDH